jgi:hypothetical protein
MQSVSVRTAPPAPPSNPPCHPSACSPGHPSPAHLAIHPLLTWPPAPRSPGHQEQLAHHPAPLADVFLHQLAPAHADEGAIGVVGHGASQQRLPCTRGGGTQAQRAQRGRAAGGCGGACLCGVCVWWGGEMVWGRRVRGRGEGGQGWPACSWRRVGWFPEVMRQEAWHDFGSCSHARVQPALGAFLSLHARKCLHLFLSHHAPKWLHPFLSHHATKWLPPFQDGQPPTHLSLGDRTTTRPWAARCPGPRRALDASAAAQSPA